MVGGGREVKAAALRASGPLCETTRSVFVLGRAVHSGFRRRRRCPLPGLGTDSDSCPLVGCWRPWVHLL